MLKTCSQNFVQGIEFVSEVVWFVPNNAFGLDKFLLWIDMYRTLVKVMKKFFQLKWYVAKSLQGKDDDTHIPKLQKEKKYSEVENVHHNI